MAKRLDKTTANDNTPMETNVQARADRIRKDFAGLFQIEGEMADLIEKYIAPLRKNRTALLRHLKADTQMPRKVLMAQYALYKLAAEAQDLGEDIRDQRMDQLREAHMALHPGETLDWIAVLDEANGNLPLRASAPAKETDAAPKKAGEGKGKKTEAAADADAEPTEEAEPAPQSGTVLPNVMEANKSGARAGLAGEPEDANPFMENSDSGLAWAKGWKGGNAQRQANMSKRQGAARQAPPEEGAPSA